MIARNPTIIFLAALLSGCMAPIGHEAFRSVPPLPAEQAYAPLIGKENQAAVGGVLMSKTNGTPAKGFIAIQDYQPEEYTLRYGSYQYFPIAKGSEWAIIGVLDSGNYLCENSNYQEPYFNGVQTTGNTALLVKDDGTAYGFASYMGNQADVFKWQTPPRAPILKKEDKVYLIASFRQEIIYNGISSNIIKMSYREFKNDFARPSFTQELLHDLAESRTVDFRGMNIEVIEATDSSIKYIINSPMR